MAEAVCSELLSTWKRVRSSGVSCSAPRAPRSLERRRLQCSVTGPFKSRRSALDPPPVTPPRDVSVGSRQYGEPSGPRAPRLQDACAAPSAEDGTDRCLGGGPRNTPSAPGARETWRAPPSRSLEAGAAPREMRLVGGARQPSCSRSDSRARRGRQRLHSQPQVSHLLSVSLA